MESLIKFIKNIKNPILKTIFTIVACILISLGVFVVTQGCSHLTHFDKLNIDNLTTSTIFKRR